MTTTAEMAFKPVGGIEEETKTEGSEQFELKQVGKLRDTE